MMTSYKSKAQGKFDFLVNDPFNIRQTSINETKYLKIKIFLVLINLLNNFFLIYFFYAFFEEPGFMLLK